MKLFNKYILIVSVAFSVFALSSCEKEITVNLNSSEPRIVIEGLIKLDSTATVRITKSKDYNTDGVFPAVNGAIVTISDDAGNTEVLKQNTAGLYCAQTIKGVVGRTYNLSVKVEDKEYTSISKMPQPVEIDTMYMYYIPSLKYAFPMIEFQDVSGVDSYYHHVVYINGKRMKMQEDVTDDEDRDGFRISRILPIFEGDNNDKKVEKGDTIWTELQTLDKGAYKFFESLARMSNTQTNPTSNIKGGALGYFSAYTYSRKEIIAEW